MNQGYPQGPQQGGYGPYQGAPMQQPPPPKKTSALVYVLIAGGVGVFGLMALCAIAGRGKSADASSAAAPGEAKATPAEAVAALPWIAQVKAACARYQAAPNQIKKSDIFNANNKMLEGIALNDVRGVLKSLSTNQGGSDLTLQVNVGDVEFKTASLSNPITKGSPVYTAAADMQIGQCVVFSAHDVKSSSMSERAQVCDTEYFVDFTALKPCK